MVPARPPRGASPTTLLRFPAPLALGGGRCTPAGGHDGPSGLAVIATNPTQPGHDGSTGRALVIDKPPAGRRSTPRAGPQYLSCHPRLGCSSGLPPWRFPPPPTHPPRGVTNGIQSAVRLWRLAANTPSDSAPNHWPGKARRVSTAASGPQPPSLQLHPRAGVGWGTCPPVSVCTPPTPRVDRQWRPSGSRPALLSTSPDPTPLPASRIL